MTQPWRRHPSDAGHSLSAKPPSGARYYPGLAESAARARGAAKLWQRADSDDLDDDDAGDEGPEAAPGGLDAFRSPGIVRRVSLVDGTTAHPPHAEYNMRVDDIDALEASVVPNDFFSGPQDAWRSARQQSSTGNVISARVAARAGGTEREGDAAAADGGGWPPPATTTTLSARVGSDQMAAAAAATAAMSASAGGGRYGAPPREGTPADPAMPSADGVLSQTQFGRRSVSSSSAARRASNNVAGSAAPEAAAATEPAAEVMDPAATATVVRLAGPAGAARTAAPSASMAVSAVATVAGATLTGVVAATSPGLVATAAAGSASPQVALSSSSAVDRDASQSAEMAAVERHRDVRLAGDISMSGSRLVDATGGSGAVAPRLVAGSLPSPLLDGGSVTAASGSLAMDSRAAANVAPLHSSSEPVSTAAAVIANPAGGHAAAAAGAPAAAAVAAPSRADAAAAASAAPEAAAGDVAAESDAERANKLLLRQLSTQLAAMQQGVAPVAAAASADTAARPYVGGPAGAIGSSSSGTSRSQYLGPARRVGPRGPPLSSASAAVPSTYLGPRPMRREVPAAAAAAAAPVGSFPLASAAAGVRSGATLVPGVVAGPEVASAAAPARLIGADAAAQPQGAAAAPIVARVVVDAATSIALAPTAATSAAAASEAGVGGAAAVAKACAACEANKDRGAHYAAYVGHVKCLEVLLERGGGCTPVDGLGRTPLFYAAARGHGECVALMVDVRMEWIDAGDNAGDTPLHIAACRGHADVVELLLESGATPTLANAKGLTPAHVAASDSCLGSLLAYGASTRVVDASGRTPLFTMCAAGRASAAALLCELEEGARGDALRIVDARGDTPLHAAACNGHRQCVRLLLYYGARVDVLDKAGLRPIDVAAANGQARTCELLETAAAAAAAATAAGGVGGGGGVDAAAAAGAQWRAVESDQEASAAAAAFETGGVVAAATASPASDAAGGPPATSPAQPVMGPAAHRPSRARRLDLALNTAAPIAPVPGGKGGSDAARDSASPLRLPTPSPTKPGRARRSTELVVGGRRAATGAPAAAPAPAPTPVAATACLPREERGARTRVNALMMPAARARAVDLLVGGRAAGAAYAINASSPAGPSVATPQMHPAMQRAATLGRGAAAVGGAGGGGGPLSIRGVRQAARTEARVSPNAAAAAGAAPRLSPGTTPSIHQRVFFPEFEAPAAATAPGGGGRGSEWTQYTDDASGQHYFYNARTGISQWAPPSRWTVAPAMV